MTRVDSFTDLVRRTLDAYAEVEECPRWSSTRSMGYTLETAGTGVLPRACSFMTKFGFNRKALVTFLETLEGARTRSRSLVVETPYA